MKPKISIVIPVFNTEKYISRCLDSALTQSLNEIELICVDDGSSDGSRDILQRYAKTDDRVKVIVQQNQGQSHAQNKAMDSAVGDFIFFLDSDDYLTDSSALKVLYDAAITTNSQVVGGLVHIFSEDKKLERHLNEVWMSRNGFPREGEVVFKDFVSPYGYTRYLYRRELLLNNGIYFPPTTFLQDALFCFPALFPSSR